MLIQSTKNAASERLKFLVYGRPGAGKTTLAGTTGEPTLLISAEAGHLSLSDADIDMVDMSTSDKGDVLSKKHRIARLVEILKYLQTDEVKKRYKWVMIDSLSEISQNIVEMLEEEKKFTGFKMWGEYNRLMIKFIKEFRDLPHYHVIFTAIAVEKSAEENQESTWEIAIAGQKVSQSIGMYFDEFFFMHPVKGDDGEYLPKLFTRGTTRFAAKDRSGKLEKIEEPNLSLIANKIKGDK